MVTAESLRGNGSGSLLSPDIMARIELRNGFLLLLVAFFFHGAHSFAAANPSIHNTAVSGWHVQHWTTEHGLPQNTVTALAQSKDGYVWIGTRAGVARFDGVRFTPLVNELFVTEPGDAGVLQMCADERDGVWIRTRAGFFWHRRGGFAQYAFGAEGVPGELLFFLAAKGTGVWLATRDALLLFRDGAIVQRFDRQNGLPCDGVDSIQWDAEEHVWITKDFRLWRMEGDRFIPFVTVFGSNITSHGTCFESRERAWFGNWGRLDVWEGGQWNAYTSEHGLPTNRWVSKVRIDSCGRRWVQPEHGLLLWDGGRFASMSGTDVLPETDIRDFMEDREGGMWVGTGRGGVYRLQSKPIRILSREDGLASPDAHTVSAGQDGRLWSGGAAGLSLLHRGEVRQFQTTGSDLGNNFTVALEDRQGRVWVSLRERGLFQLKENEFVPEPLPVTNSAQIKVTALHEDRAGRLWIGSGEGLFRRTDEGVRVFTRADGLGDALIRGIAECADGTLWIGTARAGLHLMRGDSVERCVGQENLLSHDTRPLHVEDDGTLWFSTPAALHRWRNGQIRSITTRHGLFDNEAFALLDDGRGNFWMSCNRGIYRAAAADLHAVADGRKDSLPCSVYGTADGLSSTECDGDTQPCAARLADGRLCFATTHGLALFSPAELLKHDAPPPVVIEQVKADGEVVWGEGSESEQVGKWENGIAGFTRPDPPAHSLTFPPALRLGPGTAGVLEIRYTANSLSAPEKVRFKWKLEPRDQDWHDAGSQRFVFLQNLRPGGYTFRVKACNHHGLWSEGPAVFAFSLAPHFWQTGLFYVLCGVAVVGLAAAVMAYRLRWQHRLLTARHDQALAEERARIARDLHDDLGTALTGVALEIEVARRQSQDAIATRLGESASRVRTLAERMREVVWAVNPRCDTVPSLASFLEQQAGTLLHSGGVRGRFEFPESIPPLPLDSETRHELALGVREALANVVRHAQASEVVLGLALHEDALVVSVRDNGRGFAADSAASGDGHGLHNLRVRLERVGGRCAIESKPGSGTRVEFRVPLGRCPKRKETP